MLMTHRKLCELAGLDFKKMGDDRANGADFVEPKENGRLLADLDDLAVAILYRDRREAGHTVKLAGAEAGLLRDAMRRFPAADQLTTVTLLNGTFVTQPTADIDLRTGFNSGSYVVSATMVDVRNLRARAQQALNADLLVIGGGDA